jgi:hypothetical protein
MTINVLQFVLFNISRMAQQMLNWSNNRPIVCKIDPTLQTPGFKATLFVHSPNLETLPPEYLIYPPPLPNSAYLCVVEKGEHFELFNEAVLTSICISISTFITILDFFKSDWATIELQMNRSAFAMRRKTFNVETLGNINYYSTGVANYQQWFDDVLFMADRHSHDFYQAPHLRIQHNNSTLYLNSKVMTMLALNTDEITYKLLQVGFVFPIGAAAVVDS